MTKIKLAKFKLLLTVIWLLVLQTSYAQTYVPVVVTGFNHDLIANGAGGSNRAAATTTTTFDQSNSGGDNVMYSKDFRGNNNPSTAPQFGLPTNGIINSVNLSGATYQLANYNGSNTLLLTGSGTSGTLTLGTPGVFSRIAILGSSADGSSSFNVRFNFSDGTNTTTSFGVPDWYNGGGFAIQGIGRVARSSVSFNGPDGFSGDGSNPRLYDNQVVIATPFNSKILTSITFTKSSSSGRTAILAITGVTAVNAPAAPVATAATNVNSNSFTANWLGSAGATGYYLDVATNSTFTSYTSGYNNIFVGNVTSANVSGLASGTYYYRVRAANASGISASSNTITVLPVCIPPSITNCPQTQYQQI